MKKVVAKATELLVMGSVVHQPADLMTCVGNADGMLSSDSKCLTHNASERHATFHSALIIAASFACYCAALQFSFSSFDDPVFVSQNSVVQGGLSLAGIRYAFTENFGHFSPITWMSFMAEHSLFGLNPGGFRLTNIWLHAFNSVSVYLFLGRFCGSTYLRLALALLFATHPMNIESVAWISSRKDLLAFAFGIWTIANYVDFSRNERSRSYSISVALLLLSLLCKATMMPFFLAALLLDKSGSKWAALGFGTWCLQRKCVLGVTAFAIALAFHTQSASNALELHTNVSSLLVHFLSAQLHYLAHWFSFHSCPVILNYPINPALNALLFLLLAGSCSILFWKASNLFDLRIVMIGCLFWIVFLLPVSQLIKLGAAFAADRYIYLPQIGLLIALCGLLNLIKTKTARSWLICAIYGVTVGTTLLTSSAIHRWQSSYDLWRHAVNGGHPSWVAYVNLSVEMGIRRELLKSLQTAIAGCAADENAISLFNLAGCLYDLKRFESAAWAYERSLKLDSRNRAAWLSLAKVYRNPAFSKASVEQAAILQRRAAMLPVKAYSIAVIRSVQKGKQ